MWWPLWVRRMHQCGYRQRPTHWTEGRHGPTRWRGPSRCALRSAAKRGAAARALELGALDQEAHAPRALPLVRLEPEGDRHPRRQRLGVAEPDAVDRLPLVAQL